MNPRYERWRWITFGTTWLIYASLYFTRQAFSVAKIGLSDDPRVTMSRGDFGVVDSIYGATYMVGQFAFGMLGDRFGPRRLLMVGLSLSIVAAVASGFCTSFLAFSTFALLQGIAQATGWPNVNKTMSSWFSLQERGRVLGVWCTHYTAGSAVAAPFAGWMMDTFAKMGVTTASVYARIELLWASGMSGSPLPNSLYSPLITFVPYWPMAFWSSAAVVGMVLLFAWVFLRNRPEDLGFPAIEKYHGEPESLLEDEVPEAPLPASSWQLVGEVLSSPVIWMLALAYFSIKLVRYSFIFWGPKYVSESLGSNATGSALISAVMPIGGMVGVIAGGFISDKLFQARRAPVIVLSLLITAALMLVASSYQLPGEGLMAGFFFLVGVFLFAPDSMISSTAAVDFGTKRGAGTATGIINCIGSVGGILGGYLPGKITTGSDWTPLFVVFQVGLLASAIIMIPLWRSKPAHR